MSALGHKRTFRSAIAMFALPCHQDVAGLISHERRMTGIAIRWLAGELPLGAKP